MNLDWEALSEEDKAFASKHFGGPGSGRYPSGSGGDHKAGDRVKLKEDSGLGHKKGDAGTVYKVEDADKNGNPRVIHVKMDNPDNWRTPTGGWNADRFEKE